MDELAAFTILTVAGAAMGFVNNLAGAGGLIGLAAFDLVAGMPIATANASLRPAAMAIAVSGAAGFRSRGQKIPGRAWLYGLAAVPGAVLGAFMAIKLPDWVYQTSLLLVVIVLLAQTLLGKPAKVEQKQNGSIWTALLWFTLVGAHMGFIQVAVGLLIIATLSHVHSRDLIEVNTAKMAVVLLTATTATITFALADKIDWPPALGLALGAGIGSFIGGRWSVKRGHGAIRIVVIAVCVLVLLRSIWRLF